MSRLPPQLGPYEPVQRLGAGGMAETFVALRRGPAGFEQRVCIKRILPAYEQDRDFVDAFLLEARTSALLRHANIVQVLDFGVADGSHYLALELIDGVDLRALLKREGRENSPLDAELVTLIASDVAMALDHAHGGGQGRTPLVHRDVSPSNVLASRAGEIKLTDFGIARAIGGTHHTATGIIKGKVPYLPPEYIERGRFDARSDLFSLGVMLHELLVGARPFDGESELDTVRRIVAGERAALSGLAQGAPAELMAVIDRLLATDPDARFASARALLDALPPLTVHRARLRLGELVRSQLGELETGEAARFPAGAPAAVGPGRASPAGGASEPTRTARRGLRVSRGALLAAGGALAVALTLVSALVLRTAASTGGKPPQPPDPPISVPEPTNPSSAGTDTLPSSSPTTPSNHPAPAQPLPAELRVIVIPFGDVWIDGKPKGHAPVSLKLAPGAHEVAWGDGRPIERRAVQLGAGAHENVVFRRADGEL